MNICYLRKLATVFLFNTAIIALAYYTSSTYLFLGGLPYELLTIVVLGLLTTLIITKITDLNTQEKTEPEDHQV